MKFKQELVNGPFEHPAHWKILLSNILYTGRLSVSLVALSSCSTIVFDPCSAMGRGKQWSADTVREVKTLMNIGLPLPRIAAQTGVVSRSIFSVLVNTFRSPHIRLHAQNSQLFCADIRWSSKCAQGMCTMDCDCPQNFHQDRQKLGVEPSATVGLSLSSAASRDVSYDSLSTAMDPSPVKPWLIKPAKESDRTEETDLCSAAIHDVSFDSPFTALELSVLNCDW